MTFFLIQLKCQRNISNGAGTNLKVEGGTGPERKGRGRRSGAKLRKRFLVVPLRFLALKVQLVVLASTFVVVGLSTVWSVYCLLFFYSPCSPCPA